MGNVVVQESAQITFETPQQFTGQASWAGTTGAQQLNMQAAFEGRLIGGCRRRRAAGPIRKRNVRAPIVASVYIGGYRHDRAGEVV